MDMVQRKPDRYAARAAFVSLLALILASLYHSGPAAPLERSPSLVQAAGRGQNAPRPGDAEAQPATSKKIAVNVFLLSDQPKNPNEVLDSRGSRYTYFSSRRLASPARPLAEPRPRYPAGKKAERGGAVLLQLLINERGGLDYIDVVCSAPAFEQSAVESVRGMKFKPAQGTDGPVKSYMWVEFAYGRGFPCAAVPE